LALCRPPAPAASFPESSFPESSFPESSIGQTARRHPVIPQRARREGSNATIDRELFNFGNALFDPALTADTRPQEFSAALHRLLAQVAKHFADEASVLAVLGYFALNGHKAARAGF
jgi:hypothetical protein